MKKVAILSLASLCLITSASYAAFGNFHATSPSKQTAKSSKQPLFNSINASGNLTISIVPIKTAAREFFSIQEPAKSHTRVIAHIRKQTLYLRQSAASAKAATITIHMNELNNLNLSGNSNLCAKNLRSNGLNLRANTAGKIDLNGMIKLNKVSASGRSQVNLKWVSGKTVELYSSGNSHINLAGNVNTIRATLSGHSFLNAKYLRSHHTWIKTKNFAQAEIISSQSLQAYPTNSSNIYYYKTPNLLNSMTSDAGNTLQLGWKG